MNYHLLHDHPDQSLLERLFHIRNIEDSMEDFLYPTFQRYRSSRRYFRDAPIATEKVSEVMKKQEKIMIFGDYDVDGILSSFITYIFFRDYVGYKQISLRLPHRVRDGYGIKTHHLDEIKTTGTTLIITVDNGITALQEAAYAKQLGIDMIITDHHKPLHQLPDSFALLNPQCEATVSFKEICGSTVAAKFCLALAHQLGRTREQTQQRVNDMLPYLAIATVADCMPLVGENRLIVKKGLELMNQHRKKLHQPLQTMLEFLNIKQIDTFHIWFMIAPRLNATGRIGHALDGLKALLSTSKHKQLHYLKHMDQLNGERKLIQEQMIQEALQKVNPEKKLLRAASPSFHEWVVGIVAGRISEKYQKPSLIMSVNEKEKIATGSLRGPETFNIVDMLKSADQLLLRYGGHAQAGGLTVGLDQMHAAVKLLDSFCEEHLITDTNEKSLHVDTYLHSHELNRPTLKNILLLWPYGEGNPEPVFVIEDSIITGVEQVGQKGNGHLKVYAKKWSVAFTAMQRGKGNTISEIPKNQSVNLIGKIREDTFSWGRYLDTHHIVWTDSNSMQ